MGVERDGQAGKIARDWRLWAVVFMWMPGAKGKKLKGLTIGSWSTLTSPFTALHSLNIAVAFDSTAFSFLSIAVG